MGASARVALGLLLLGLAYAVTVPPLANVDEADHHTRVQGIAGGVWVGTPAAPPDRGLTALQRPFVEQTTRAVRVPAGRSGSGFGCVAQTGARAPCQHGIPPNPARTEPTPVGTYQPLPYVLPALVARAADRTPGAVRLERIASLLLAGGLLAAAALVAGRAPGLLTGVVLAATPLAVCLTAAVGGSGLEIAAAIALTVTVLARGPALLGVVAVVALVGARSLGPLWLVAIAGVALALRVRPPWAVIGAGAVAVVLQRVWEARYGPSVTTDLVPLAESLRAGVRELPDTLRQAVGGFGYLERRTPVLLALAWGGLVAVLVARVRERRLLLAATIAAALAAAPYMFAAATRFTGFDVQGRHVLPALVLVPLLAAHLGRPPRWLIPAAAVLHLIAFGVLAQSYGTLDVRALIAVAGAGLIAYPSARP